MGDGCRRFNSRGPMVLLKNGVPLFRGDLALIGEIPVFIDNFRLDDIEYLLGVYIAAFVTLTFFAVHKIDASLEVSYSVYRVSIIDLVAACVEDKQLIEHLEY